MCVYSICTLYLNKTFVTSLHVVLFCILVVDFVYFLLAYQIKQRSNQGLPCIISLRDIR